MEVVEKNENLNLPNANLVDPNLIVDWNDIDGDNNSTEYKEIDNDKQDIIKWNIFSYFDDVFWNMKRGKTIFKKLKNFLSDDNEVKISWIKDLYNPNWDSRLNISFKKWNVNSNILFSYWTSFSKWVVDLDIKDSNHNHLINETVLGLPKDPLELRNEIINLFPASD